MNTESSIQYCVYNLWHYFAEPPNDLRCCPKCGGSITRSGIPRSKAAEVFLASAGVGLHCFTYLYRCQNCHWWATWECCSDEEFAGAVLQYLITSLEQPEVSGKPWERLLSDEHVYEQDMPLPESLAQVFVGGRKRVHDIPNPGARVRLVGDVYVLLKGQRTPLYIEGSEGTVITDEELYAAIREKTKARLNDDGFPMWLEDFARGQFIESKITMNLMNYCFIRLDQVIYPADKAYHPCKPGEIYQVDAANITKIGS